MAFENKVVLITGAGSGIGQASAIHFAQQGASLLLADVNTMGLDDTLAQIAPFKANAYAMRVDVGEKAQVDAMVQEAVTRFGGLHIAINSAGISGAMLKPIVEADDDEYEAIMRVNVRGVWLCMKAQIPAIIASGGGSIINLASVAGLIGSPRGAAYAASKHAVIGLTRSVALELARKGVRVNAVCPSFIDTPMVRNVALTDERIAQSSEVASPMRRYGRVEEVVSAIAWLADESASFANGIALPIDGGLTAS